MLKMIAPLNSALLYYTLVHIHWFPLVSVALCVLLSGNLFIPEHSKYLI